MSRARAGRLGGGGHSRRRRCSGVDCLKCPFHRHTGLKARLGLESLRWKSVLERVRSRCADDVASLMRNSEPFFLPVLGVRPASPQAAWAGPSLSPGAPAFLVLRLSQSGHVLASLLQTFFLSSFLFLFSLFWIGPPIFFLSCFPACWLSALPSGTCPPLSSVGCVHFFCHICELPRGAGAVPGPTISELITGFSEVFFF